MFVIKRDGRKEKVHFDKITARIKKLSYGLTEHVDPVIVSQKVCAGVKKGILTSELDELAAETAAALCTEHPEYGLLAARIAVSNLHKETLKSFHSTCKKLYACIEPKTQRHTPLLADNVWEFIQKNAEVLDSAIVYDRDYDYDFFAYKTLERSYLLKVYDPKYESFRIVERPQHMLMRVSCGLHCGDIDATIETYNLMSLGWFTHASPTLFNSGTPLPQLSSCFLLDMAADSIEGIYTTLKQTALISKYAGGIGLSISKIRATGSYIGGTNGTSNGIVPMLRNFNSTARYVDQGGGKRKGAFAVYLEPWHFDIFDFLDLRKNHGDEERRCRDLFLGLWIPDLFMKRVEQDSTWSLLCPRESPGLEECWGEKFEKLYEHYEKTGRVRKVIKARVLWQSILEAQIETGNPYMLYKDACNGKSNQQNVGMIHSSNLCTEIIQHTSPEEIAVCNLSSIALPKFCDTKTLTFDHKKLFEVTQVVTRNLNKVININHYPVEQARRSNMRHRPIGIGVQGLADAFILLRLPFESPEAQILNRDIFETILFAAMSASVELAKKFGPYETFAGSPASQGKLQFDLWGVTPKSGRYDWNALKAEIKQHGLRNSLFVAPMPTASTSQILGNNECFEPYTSNIYVRRTLAGEFVCVSKHLLKDLVRLKLWNPKLKNKLIAHNGSVQNIPEIPKDLRELYKTVWEMKQKTIIDMAAARGAYIDQSQSLNIHMTNVNFAKLTSMHFYAWKQGLKTGMYYLRTKAAVDAIKFTVDQSMLKEEAKVGPEAPSSQKVDEKKHDKEKEKEKEKNDGGMNERVFSPIRFDMNIDYKTPPSLSIPSSSSSSSSSSASSSDSSYESQPLPSPQSPIPPPSLLSPAISVSSIPSPLASALRRQQSMSDDGKESEKESEGGRSSPDSDHFTLEDIKEEEAKEDSKETHKETQQKDGVAVVQRKMEQFPMGLQMSATPLPNDGEEDSASVVAWRKERERLKKAELCKLNNGDACVSCGS